MTKTMYELALDVAEGRMSAEDAADQMAGLGNWVTPEQYNSDESRAERFQDDLPIAADNSFIRVTELFMSRRLTAEQYATLKSAFALTFKDE